MSTKSSVFVPLVCGSMAFVVYAFTLCPGVTNRGDTGELIAASHTLGIAHPSGYPLFMVLGRFFELLPLGTLALRYNLLSATFGALTVGVVAATTQRLTANAMAAALAALAFGFSPSFWGQAEFAEVYTLNAFFIALALQAAVAWRQTGDARWLAGGSLAVGLGLSNHMTIALIVPALLVVLVAGGSAGASSAPLIRRLLLAAGFLLCGIAVNAYLPIRASTSPVLDGGYLSGGLGLLGMLVGKHYLNELAQSGGPQLAEGAGLCATLIAMNLHLLLPLALIGIGAMVLRDRPMLLMLLLATSPFPPFFIAYGQPGVQYFLIPTFLITAMLGGVGWDRAIRNVSRVPVKLGVPLAVIVSQLLIALPICDAREDRISARYAEAILRAAEPNATIIINDDIVAFPLYFYRYAAERRSEVKLVFNHEAVVWRQTVRDNWLRGPVYTVFWYDQMGDEFTLSPAGPLMRVVRRDDLPVADRGSFDHLPVQRQAYEEGRLLRLRLSESTLAPRQLATVDMLWGLEGSARTDLEVFIFGKRQGSGEEKTEAETMRVRGRWHRFHEQQPLGYCYRGQGRLGDGEVAHSMILQVAEEALPGRYDLLVALTKMGATEATALRLAKKVSEFTVWSIRGATVF